MTDDATTLEDLKREHEGLYNEVLQHHKTLARHEGGRRFQDFQSRVDAFLNQVSQVSGQVTTIEDFNWLTDTALKWQVVFSSLLNVPRNIEPLRAPSKLEAADPSSRMSAQEVDAWLQQQALQQSILRKASKALHQTGFLLNWIPSTKWDMELDWSSAAALFASKVLDGSFDLVDQLEPAAYPQLEDVWLEEVKRLRAYMRWESGSAAGDQQALDDKANYFVVCEGLRQGLVDAARKATPVSFSAVSYHLKRCYFSGGHLDLTRAETSAMLRRKAYLVSLRQPSRSDTDNWDDAVTYCKMFYDHIIPAAADRKRDDALHVLKAFQFSEASGFHIINAFEAAVAVYFLEADPILEWWTSAEGIPWRGFCKANRIPLSDWNDRWVSPGLRSKLSYDHLARELVFLGVMTEAERAELLAGIPSLAAASVEDLFQRSRLLPRETTI